MFDDKFYLSMLFYLVFGRTINWKHPKSFNEKLNWLKINNRNPLYTSLVDKLAVKDFVSKKIGSQYIIPTFNYWESVDQIDFASLPDKFVIKTTHDSNSTFICRDKAAFDFIGIKEKLRYALQEDFSNHFREYVYRDVPHRIICEQLLETEDNEGLRDYKLFCFNGKVKFLKVDFDRTKQHKANYYSPNWRMLPFGERICPPDPKKIIQRPKNLCTMVYLAELLSDGMPFVRVDFYNIEGKIYFGEMTFFPAAGFGHFTPEWFDLEIGSLLKLNIP